MKYSYLYCILKQFHVLKIEMIQRAGERISSSIVVNIKNMINTQEIRTRETDFLLSLNNNKTMFSRAIQGVYIVLSFHHCQKCF